jgi:hypothetical protein
MQVPKGSIGTVVETSTHEQLVQRSQPYVHRIRRRGRFRDRSTNGQLLGCLVKWNVLDSNSEPISQHCPLYSEQASGRHHLLKAEQDTCAQSALQVAAAELGRWEKEEAPKVYGRGCACGRSLKPPIYFECSCFKPMACPCCPRRFSHCCNECPTSHSASCEHRHRNATDNQVFKVLESEI